MRTFLINHLPFIIRWGNRLGIGRSERWDLADWDCPPHDFGPEYETGFGLGRKCSKCRKFLWTEDDDTALRRLSGDRWQAR